MIVIESIINNVTYSVELGDVSTLSVSQAIAAKDTAEQVAQMVLSQRTEIDGIASTVTQDRQATQTLRNETEGIKNAAVTETTAIKDEAVNANLSAQQAKTEALAAAQQASAVTLQQSFGRKFVPTISLDATSRTVPSYLPCTRAGVATFFDQAGILRTANANEGRIDFDPVTGECLGLLDEGETTNGVYNSTFFNFVTGTSVGQNGWGVDQAWGSNVQPIVENIIILNGIRYMDFRISGTPANTNALLISTNNINPRPTINPGQRVVVTFNFQVLSSLVQFFIQIQVLWLDNSGNLVAGENSINVSNNSQNTLTKITHISNPAPSGISRYRIRIVKTSPSANLTQNALLRLGAVQTEVGNFATSFIPTTNQPITRPADLFQTTGFQFARRYNQREGTFYVNTRAISDLTTTVAVFSDGTTNNETRLLANGTLTIRKGGVQIATIQATGATVGTNSIFGFTYKGTRIVITRNGATVGVVTASEELATNYTTFQLGTGIYVRNLRYVPRAFSDSELQFVTNPLYFVGLEGDKVPTINDLSSGAFMDIEDIYAANPEIQTFFGIGSAQTIVINRPYPFILRQVYLSPSGVTSSTLPTLPSTGFFAANTDYNIVFNATNVSQLTISITRVLV